MVRAHMVGMADHWLWTVRRLTTTRHLSPAGTPARHPDYARSTTVCTLIPPHDTTPARPARLAPLGSRPSTAAAAFYGTAQRITHLHQGCVYPSDAHQSARSEGVGEATGAPPTTTPSRSPRTPRTTTPARARRLAPGPAGSREPRPCRTGSRRRAASPVRALPPDQWRPARPASRRARRQWVAAYDQHGRPVPCQGADDQLHQLVADWFVAAREHGLIETQMLTTTTRDEAHALNHLARQARVAAGNLDDSTALVVGDRLFAESDRVLPLRNQSTAPTTAATGCGTATAPPASTTRQASCTSLSTPAPR